MGLRFLRLRAIRRNRIARLSDVPPAAADVLRGDRCVARLRPANGAKPRLIFALLVGAIRPFEFT
jgi:hypothetical protein